MKPTPDFLVLLNQFNESLQVCRSVYVDGGHMIVEQYPHLLTRPDREFLAMLDDLHRGLVIKLFVEIAGVDCTWTEAEEHLASIMFFHLWNRQLGKKELRESLRHIKKQSAAVQWDSLVRPFAEIEPLRERIPELETAVIRIGNLIARSDGRATSLELDSLKSAQDGILGSLHRADTGSVRKSGNGREPARSGELELAPPVGAFPNSVVHDPATESRTPDTPQIENTRPDLDESLAHLDELVGLDAVKQEVRTLVNYLDLQQRRVNMGLPRTEIGLHMVFAGNPGTGKTTIARILGRIFAAMGILDRGHLVETDRAGLVAEYAGQTSIKTDKLIDQSLGGVLFIDEAYSLVSSTRDDLYGNEAIQKLLKRMEDDRQNLVVILAGYPAEMERLLHSNPGLSSRINLHIEFEDYTPIELARIFEWMCNKNQYRITGMARGKLLAGLAWMHEQRDPRFGNGRFVRNLFEHSIRRLANRIVGSSSLSRNLLTRFESEDIGFPEAPESVTDADRVASTKYTTTCPECRIDIRIGCKLLGRKVKCKQCQHRFRIGWCDPVHE